MTSLSVQAVSRLSPEYPDSADDPGTPVKARQHSASAASEDKVEISARAKAKSKLLNKVNSASEAQGLSAASRPASAAHDNPKLSEIDRAKLLKRQGDKIAQIAVILNLPPKTVENYLGGIGDSATYSGTQTTAMIGKSGT